MKQMYYIGVDVSKHKVDIAVINVQREVLLEKEVNNNPVQLRRFIERFILKYKAKTEELLICCEHTGIYNRPIQVSCTALGVFLWEENALKIKKAASDMRGKSDKKDALRIAEYALRYEDQKYRYAPPGRVIVELDKLLKARDTIIGQITAMTNQLGESKAMDPIGYKTLHECYKAPIKALEKQLSEIEKKINDLIKKDPDVQKNVELLTSITGIGKQNALQFILHTNNFRDFESANHLACYAGVVPFPNQSGTVTKRERVSKMANQKLKKLLHMAALSCLRAEGELKDYFIRKVKEGKNKMLVINAIRNKLVHRIFAVIKRQTPYIKSWADAANTALNPEMTWN